MNMILFLGTFSLLAQPDAFIDAILIQIRGENETPLPQRERAEYLLRKTLLYLGIIGCGLLLGWSILTGFVITLYRDGFFWRF